MLVFKLSKSCSDPWPVARYPLPVARFSDRHIHNVLVRVNQFVAHFDGGAK